MIRVVLIGSGNVASHLFKAFQNAENVEVLQIYTRKLVSDFPNQIQTHDFALLQDADVYIISVTDSAIEEVSNQLLFKNKLVVHTSGTTSFEVINNYNKRGVFYPLQTFSKNKEVNFKEIPICLEVENNVDEGILNQLAKTISNEVYFINGEQRKALHVAAVFVCNFVNHLYQIGNEICLDNNIPFKILQPLIVETAQKIKLLSPKEAQTGPAVRNDEITISKHLDFLHDENQKNIYQLLTKSIQNVKKL